MKKIRGVWLTSAASNILDSRANIAAALQLLVDTGFTTVFPVVWNNGFTFYPSQVMKEHFQEEIAPNFAGRDILAEVIESAPSGLEVIPWFEYGFAASFGNNGGHLLAKKPQWAGKARGDKLLIKNNFVWMNALDREVQDFLQELFLEVATKYPVAGVQGDDRLPAMPSEGGYDSKTRALYASEFSKQPPNNSKDQDWLKWRANILNNFLERLYRSIKNINPDLIVSMAPSDYPFSYNEYLQDVPAWLDREIVDLIHPQLYRQNLNDYKNLITQMVNRFGQKQLTKIYPGILTRIGNFQLSSNDLWEAIRHNRRSGVRGEVFFFLESLHNASQASFLRGKNYADFLFLQLGNIGEDVEEIQGKLTEKGFLVGTVDGEFGSKTKLAVERFQSANGLTVDGVIGPLTYARLTD
jgi:uncharacterized lipoprotein YddW (UPF0748 family)